MEGLDESGNIAAARLGAQRMVRSEFSSPAEVVGWMGAVQSQDYRGARWALGLRTDGATDARVHHLFDEGAIVRTHVLRPTWHFVLPRDVRWLLELTGPRVLSGLAGRHRQLEIDAEVSSRARQAFEEALAGGSSLTRAELGKVLSAANIPPESQRLPHLLLVAELEGGLVSGPMKGKQHTWALLEERVPDAPRLDREEALRELALRYFLSHGPAQAQDMAWWSGLNVTEIRRGIEIAGRELEQRAIDGKEYWFDPELDWDAGATNAVNLLPNFDECTVGYRDRSALFHADYPFRPELFAFSSILSNTVTAGGQLRGAWRRVEVRGGTNVEVRPLAALPAPERAGVERACERFAAFLERPVELIWQ